MSLYIYSVSLCVPFVVIVFKGTFLFYFFRHIASFLSVFKLLVIGLVIIGRDPFALFGMQAPGIWEWGQGNKVRFPGTVGVVKVLILWESTIIFMRTIVLEGGVRIVSMLQLSICSAGNHHRCHTRASLEYKHGVKSASVSVSDTVVYINTAKHNSNPWDVISRSFRVFRFC